VAAGVSWSKSNFQLVAAHVQALTGDQVDGRFRSGVYAHPKKSRTALHTPQGVVLRMQSNRGRRAAPIGYPCRACQVIEMSVRQPDISDAPSAPGSFSDDQISLVGGIDYDGFPTCFVCD
jgi:hypothetical protein